MVLLEVQQLLFQSSMLVLQVTNGQFDLTHNPSQSSRICFHNCAHIPFSLISATAKKGKYIVKQPTVKIEILYCYSTQNSTLNAINGIALQITYFRWKSSAVSLALSSFKWSSVFSTKRLWIFQGQMGMCGWSLLIFHWA